MGESVYYFFRRNPLRWFFSIIHVHLQEMERSHKQQLGVAQTLSDR